MLLRTGIGLAIRVYRKTPLYPGFGAALASLLGRAQPSGDAAPVECSVDGFRMRLFRDRVIDSQLYYTGSFEPDTERTIRKLVRAGDVVADVGANIGYLTLHLARRVGASGRVYAFEPADETFDRLTTNLGLNNLPQVVPVRAGVSDTPSEGVSVTIQSTYRLDGRDEGVEQRIRLTTIDDLVEEEGLTRLDFLKIDTDGMEVNVLRGARRSLERFRPSILTECGPSDLLNAGTSAGVLIGSLESLGYAFYRPGSLRPVRGLDRRLKKLKDGTSMNLVAVHKERGVGH